MESYIRFDWAMKRLLRNKANYAVLEGLLTTLLEEKVTIQKLLESESNQEDEFDKYNRVDMLAENSKDGKPGPICTKLYTKLRAIQYGDEPDTHNWVTILD